MKRLKPVMILLPLSIMLLIFAMNTEAQAIRCSEQLKMYEDAKANRYGEQDMDCYCPDPSAETIPICKEKSSIAPSTGGYGNRDIQMQMMQAILAPLFQSIFSDPPQDNYREHLRRQQEEQRREEEKRKKEEAARMKREALNRWQALQDEDAAKKDREAKERAKAGEDLLIRMGAAGGGRLSPFKWEQGTESELRFQSMGAGEYPTANLKPLERVACAAYFSSAALKALESRNDEQARFLNEQADKVMARQPTKVECQFLKNAVPEPPAPEMANAGGQELVDFLSNLQKDVKSLQEMESRLFEAKERIRAAESKKEAAQAKLNEVQNSAETASSDKKDEADALAVLREADKELADAVQLGNALAEEKEKMRNEIKNKMEANMQTRNE